MGVPVFTHSQERTPARSAALTAAAMPVASLLAGGRVSEVGSMEAVSMEAVSMGVVADAIGNQMYQPLDLIEN